MIRIEKTNFQSIADEINNNSIYEINVVDVEQAMTRKSFKVDEDEGDDEETVVLFSKTDEISHELD